MIVDLFAGPGGWDEGAKMLGLSTVGLEWDHAACMTAVAAGHPRIECDVAAYPTEPFVGKTTGLIASPPCQAWSMAGKRKGEHDRAACHQLADRMAQSDDSTAWTEWEDERSALVCQPVRWVRDLRPEWIALEEVPAVLGLWEHFGRIFRAWGYSVWVGVLNAADYGVPQRRRRTILMASRVDLAAPPVPTHSRLCDEGGLFGADREQWVSMESAIGWGFDEPAATISGGGTDTGGAEPFANARYRRKLAAFVSAGVTGCGRPKLLTAPADTLTGKGTAYWLTDDGGSVRLSVVETAVLQSFPADYPWRGGDGKQRQQIGNAVPPLLAAHVLSALTGSALQAVA